MRITVLAGCGAAVSLAGVATAQIVDMEFEGTGKGRNVKIITSEGSQNVFAGQLEHLIAGAGGSYAWMNGEHLTFCVDVTEHVTRDPIGYDIVGLEQVPLTTGGVFGSEETASALQSIYASYSTLALASDADRDLAAAFQLAVWEIAEDYDAGLGLASLDLGSGGFQAYRTNGNALQSGVADRFADIIATAEDDASFTGLFGLANAGRQDQLLVGPPGVIPGPGALALAACGFGLVARRRRAK